jgi:molybdenum cofactor cytidylyltransferase
MERNPSIGLILLAAGGSSRLGRPKQLLDYRGRPLLRHAAETALASRCRPVVVVLGAEVEACTAALEGLSLRLVINTDWPNGLSTSLRAGLAALENETPALSAVILCVADQPLLTPLLLDSLIEHHLRTDATRVAAEYAGKPGVPALFARSLFPQLKSLRGDEGARHLLRDQPDSVARVPFPEGSLDIDTAGDYENLAGLSAPIPKPPQ